jgi:streptogramin lyase
MMRAAFMLSMALLALPAAAETVLYAASNRAHFTASTTGIWCNLYRIDPGSGKFALLAPVRVNDEATVTIVTLAIHPATDAVYAASGARSPTAPNSLLTLDPRSGEAKVLGPIGHVVSDLAFTDDGRLYAWLPEENRLARVDPATGAATLFPPSGITGEPGGGGFVIDDRDVGYVAATGAVGTLDRVDIKTGKVTPGPHLTGAPFPASISNLTFSPDDRMYAVNSNMGAPAATALVTIDPASGKVKEVGKLPNDSHALIFVPRDWMRTWILIAGGVGAVLAIAGSFIAMRKKRRRA